jgi:hypothetical protein
MGGSPAIANKIIVNVKARIGLDLPNKLKSVKGFIK